MTGQNQFKTNQFGFSKILEISKILQFFSFYIQPALAKSEVGGLGSEVGQKSILSAFRIFRKKTLHVACLSGRTKIR